MDDGRTDQRHDLQIQLRILVSGLDLGRVDPEPIEDAVRQLEELGVIDLMTLAESARVAIDNLPTMLDDPAGIRARLETPSLGARLIDTMSATEIRDWWGGTEPDVLIAPDTTSGSAAELFESFGTALTTALAMQNLLAAWAPEVDAVDDRALWPPVSSIVTNHPAFREWTLHWGGRLVWWERTREGSSASMPTPLGTEGTERFTCDQVSEAVSVVTDWLLEPWGGVGIASDHITLGEHRRIEVVLQGAQEALDRHDLTPETRLQIEMLTRILHLRMNAPKPDRTIVGRALHGLASFAGGVLVGVASTYLTALLVKFGVPMP